MAKRMTLKEQLLEIAEPAPKDFDPEDSYASYKLERSDKVKDQETAELGRKDYVDVGESRLRKKGEAVMDSKYEGKKSSRKALYEDDMDDDQEREEEDDEEDDNDDEELDGDLADLLNGGDEDDSEEDEDIPSESSEAEPSPPPPPPKKSSLKPSSKSKPSTSAAPLSLAQEEAAMITSLKTASQADVDKGRSVKKQLAFCDNVLEARIKLQPSLNAINSLPQTENSQEYFLLVPESIKETLEEVIALQEELFTLRQDLLSTNEKIELPNKFGEKRKRLRREMEDDEDEENASGSGTVAKYQKALLEDLSTFDLTIDPFLRSTISKWSDKVLSASGLLKSSKTFKSSQASQNSLSQIDHSLNSTSEMERLIRRTRVDRREGKAKGVVGKKGGEGLLIAEKEGKEGKREKEVDEEIYDDGDFYSQMLRDLVESRLLDLDDPTMAALRLASSRSKKTKNVVDTRASKGRKIRYHVHEKMQNFMIPIDAAGWHEEQIDELFAGLLGRKSVAVAKEKEVDGEGKEGLGKGFRLFG